MDSLRARRPLTYGVIAGLLALAAVLIYGPWLSASQQSWLTDIAWMVFSLGAALRCFLTAVRDRRRRERMGWLLLGAAAFVWFLGMVYLVVGQLGKADFPPYPTLANLGFLALAPCFTAAIYFLTAREPAQRFSWNRVANLGLVSTATVAVALIILLEPLLGSGKGPAVLVLSILDPALFGIAALFTLTCLWLRDFGFRPAIGWLLFAAIALHAASDHLYFASILVPQSSTLRLDILWLVAFSFQYVAAFERDLDHVTRHSHERPAEPAAQSLAEAVLPPAMVVGTLLVAVAFRENLNSRLFAYVTPLIITFAIVLGLKEWRTHRREKLLLSRLLESDARFRQVLAASPAVVFHCSPEGDHPATFLSHEALSGLGLRDPDPTLWSERVHPQDQDAVAGDFDQLLETGSASSEYRMQDDGGIYRWVQRKMILLRAEDGRPRQIIGAMVDVSSTKQAEIQMLQGQRLEALGKLTGGIAHDFNNLLMTILGYAELALGDPTNNDLARTSLQAIEDAGEKAASLTAQLLAFGRQRSEGLKILDVNSTIAGMLGLLERLIGEHIQVELEEHHPAVAVESDPGHLESLIMNLALNARDAMPSGGRLRIEIDQTLLNKDSLPGQPLVTSGAYGEIRVSDTGTGMSEETKGQIFDPFFSTKPMGQGTGLGLSTAYGIVQQHGGVIDVSSTPGAGSCFRVFLPLAEASPSETRSGDANAPVPGGTERLLVVDDDRSIQQLLTHALTAFGYRVASASSAEEALSLTRGRKAAFDLLLTDVVLPGINGRQLAEVLRRECPGLRVVFMTGYTDDLQLLGDAARGRLPLLRKPLSLSRLALTIRQTLDNVAVSASLEG